MKKLVWIYVKLAGNCIKMSGINAFCENFGKVIERVICMNLDFGGSIDKTNKLES